MSDAYARIAAGIIADILIENPVRTVPRSEISARWYAIRPQDQKPVRHSERAHAKYRIRSYLGQKVHRGYNQGSVGGFRVREGLRILEDLGVLERADGIVRVLDVPMLVLVRDHGVAHVRGGTA